MAGTHSLWLGVCGNDEPPPCPKQHRHIMLLEVDVDVLESCTTRPDWLSQCGMAWHCHPCTRRTSKFCQHKKSLPVVR